MPTLRDSNLDEVLTSLDAWGSFAINPASSLFLAAVGFEDRASACFADWSRSRTDKGGTALLIHYPFNKSENEIQEAKFLELAGAARIQVYHLNYQRLSLYGEAVAFLKEHAQNISLTLDISAMASFVFYPLMSAIADVATKSSLQVCYTEATHYFPEAAEWNEFKDKFKTLDLVERARLFDEYHFQSMGVENVFEAPNFSGKNLSIQPTNLVLVPNFAVERVQRMLNFGVDNYSINREECEWVIGMPPNRSENGWRYDALWELFRQPSRKHDSCTLNFKEVLITLHNIWKEKNESRSLVVATVGSKAQHLGTFMFLRMHPEVGLVLSEPKQFTAGKYSTGIGTKWQTSLGRVGDLMNRLLDWNRITFEW